MNIDIDFSLAYYVTNVNVYEYRWQSYGHAIWYNSQTETYDQAIERVKAIIQSKIYSDHPHLTGTEIRYSDANLPVIDYSKM